MEEKTTLTFIARIKDKKGNIIEREVETIIPDPENMDYSSMDTFLKTFDEVERPALKARNAVGEEAIKAYLKEATKGGKKGAPNTTKKK